jgi:hypothetical protein
MTTEPLKRQVIHISETNWNLLLEILSKQRDVYQHQNEVTAAIDELLTESLKPLQQADPSKLTYEVREGQKGQYEKAFPDKNPTEDFKILQEKIREHGGRMRIGDTFFWVMDDGSVCRKFVGK